jgi:Fe-S-cluster containining protein
MKLPIVQPWYAADGLRFTCTQCGNCCTGAPGAVWMSAEEMRRLAEHLKMSVQKMADKYCRKIGERWSLKERVSPKGEYDCIFLKTIDENGKERRICSIYEVRPLQCRTWPFWPEIIKSPESWAKAHERCPGMDHGKRYSQEQIESLRDAKDWP